MKKYRIRKKIYNRFKNSFPPPELEACLSSLYHLRLKPWPEALIWRPHRRGQRCRIFSHVEEMEGWLKLSMEALKPYWDTPEEDAAWAHLGNASMGVLVNPDVCSICVQAGCEHVTR
jgi:hypothetical protein